MHHRSRMQVSIPRAGLRLSENAARRHTSHIQPRVNTSLIPSRLIVLFEMCLGMPTRTGCLGEPVSKIYDVFACPGVFFRLIVRSKLVIYRIYRYSCLSQVAFHVNVISPCSCSFLLPGSSAREEAQRILEVPATSSKNGSIRLGGLRKYRTP